MFFFSTAGNTAVFMANEKLTFFPMLFKRPVKEALELVHVRYFPP